MSSSTSMKTLKRKMDDSLAYDSPEELPPELISEVLARLPAKTLLQFRCVSKPWCSMIDSSDFIKFQNQLINHNNIENSRLLVTSKSGRSGSNFTVRCGKTGKIIDNLGIISNDYSIIQTCNGLVLIEEFRRRGRARDFVMLVWNPFIRKALILPKCPLECPHYWVSYVFGFSPLSNEYKVVAFQCFWEVGKVRMAVYSLSDGVWRVKNIEMNNIKGCGLSMLGYERGCFFHGGAIYWVGNDHMSQDRSEKVTRLVLFDLDVEEVKSVELPDGVNDSSVWFIFPFGESVAVFTMSLPGRCCIWALERGGGLDSWRLEFSGDPSQQACELLKNITKKHDYLFSGIVFVQESNTFLIAGRPLSKLMSYNIASQEIKKLGRAAASGEIYIDICVESLVLHRGFEGQNLISFPVERANGGQQRVWLEKRRRLHP